MANAMSNKAKEICLLGRSEEALTEYGNILGRLKKIKKN